MNDPSWDADAGRPPRWLASVLRDVGCIAVEVRNLKKEGSRSRYDLGKGRSSRLRTDKRPRSPAAPLAGFGGIAGDDP